MIINRIIREEESSQVRKTLKKNLAAFRRASREMRKEY